MDMCTRSQEQLELTLLEGGSLSAPLQAHLSACPSCAAEAASLQTLISALQATPAPVVPAHLTARLVPLVVAAAQQGRPARNAVPSATLNNGPMHDGPTWEPPVDIVETKDDLMVQVALPGVSAESVTVSLEAGLITVSATRGFPAGDRRARVHRLEIPFGRFVRRIALPAGIAAHAIELIGRNLADGCLTLTFRKLEVA